MPASHLPVSDSGPAGAGSAMGAGAGVAGTGAVAAGLAGGAGVAAALGAGVAATGRLVGSACAIMPPGGGRGTSTSSNQPSVDSMPQVPDLKLRVSTASMI